jgi:hypothetical protein
MAGANTMPDRGLLMARNRQLALRSMAADRLLIELAKTKTLDAIAKTLRRPPEVILNKAKRLGVSIRRK